MGQDRRTVLIIAEACNPEWTSVPLVGFNIYDSVAAHADVTLVTQVRNRAALERRFGTSRRIEFIDSEALASPFHKLGRILTLGRGLGWTTRQAMMWLPYLYFEKLVWKRFRDELLRGEFELIHRVTPLTPTYPSPIASWCDVPFVMGPLNGGLPWPKGTAKVRLAEMEWLSYVRGAYKLLPFVKRTYRRAARIICGSEYTMASLPRAAAGRTVYMPENGIDPDRFHAKDRQPPSTIKPFRILFVGRLVPYKGAHHVIQAYGESTILREQAEVVIVGDGPEKERLSAMINTLGVAERVKLTGALPQAQVGAMLRESSVFAFPSIREFGGAVVMEAMACGLPCVVADYGGPAELITRESGVTIPVGTGIASALREKLEGLLAEPARLDSMSRAGVEWAIKHYSWTAKAASIHEIYEQVLRER